MPGTTPTQSPKKFTPKGVRESSKPNDLNQTQSPPQRLRGRRQRRARGNIEKRAWQSRGVAVAKRRKESLDLPRSSSLRLRGEERPRAGERKKLKERRGLTREHRSWILFRRTR